MDRLHAGAISARILSFFFVLSLHLPALGAENLTIKEWLDVFVDSCVGSGSSFTASGTASGDVGFSLKTLRADGGVAGEVRVSKNEYRLLSEGISNRLNDVAAGQADKVRECLAPVRQNLMEAMAQQIQGQGGGVGPLHTIYILNPYEERIVKALAATRGVGGETGQLVKLDQLLHIVSMSDIRYRATVRELQSKILAMEIPYARLGQSGNIESFTVVSLTPDGEAYSLKMGYAQ